MTDAEFRHGPMLTHVLALYLSLGISKFVQMCGPCNRRSVHGSQNVHSDSQTRSLRQSHSYDVWDYR